MADAASSEIAQTDTPAAATQAAVPALSSAAVAAASEAISAETKRAYASRLRRLETQLAGRPADDHGLSEALSELARTGLSPAWLAQAAAATRFAARLAGRPDPIGASCELVLKAHRRKSEPPRQAAALDWAAADAAAAVAANGGTDLAGLRDGAIIAVMSDALLRVSEVASLDSADIARDADGSATVTVRRSKTDQEGEGAVLYLGAPTVRRLSAWQEAAAISDGPLFRAISKSGRVASRADHGSERPADRHRPRPRHRHRRRQRTLAQNRLGPKPRQGRRRTPRSDARRPLAIPRNGQPLRPLRTRRPRCHRPPPPRPLTRMTPRLTAQTGSQEPRSEPRRSLEPQPGVSPAEARRQAGGEHAVNLASYSPSKRGRRQ